MDGIQALINVANQKQDLANDNASGGAKSTKRTVDPGAAYELRTRLSMLRPTLSPGARELLDQLLKR
jgi:hypothetical protein